MLFFHEGVPSSGRVVDPLLKAGDFGVEAGTSVVRREVGQHRVDVGLQLVDGTGLLVNLALKRRLLVGVISALGQDLVVLRGSLGQSVKLTCDLG